jgi:hypothetical protein
MFWDSSALLPYLVKEAMSEEVTVLLEADRAPLIWWATPVECVSALERRRREGSLDQKPYREGRGRLSDLLEEMSFVQPHPLVRSRAERLLAAHPLRSADALQLAAALVACDERPQGEAFVSFDSRLREAAEKEGFKPLPEAPRI